MANARGELRENHMDTPEELKLAKSTRNVVPVIVEVDNRMLRGST